MIASFITALLSEFAGAALGFGPAILYEVSWEVCAIIGISSGDLKIAISNLCFFEAPCGIVQLLLLRHHFRPRLCVLLNVPMALGVPVGTLLLESCGDSLWLKRLLGFLFLVLAAQQAFGQRPLAEVRRDLESKDASVEKAVIGFSFTSGLFRGLLGVAGPPMMLLLRLFSVEPIVWRCAASTGRLTMVVIQSIIFGFNSDLPLACWPTYLALAGGGLVGLFLGNRAAGYIDAAACQRWLLLFLGAGALLMLCAGKPKLSAAAAVVVLGSAAATALAPVVKMWRRPQLKQDLATREYILRQCGSPHSASGLDGKDDEAALVPFEELASDSPASRPTSPHSPVERFWPNT